MHELNIVTYVIDQVKEIAEQNELTEIDSVTLELGEVSGVVSDYLKDCWAWYAKKTPLIQNASLELKPSRLSPGVTPAKPHTQRSNTERPAPTAAAARPGCSRVMK